MTDLDLAKEMRELLFSRGATLVGFADLSPIPEDARQGFPRGVSIAVRLDPPVVAAIKDGPNEEYACQYDTKNQLLGEIANAGADLLQGKGFKATPRTATLHELPDDLITPLPQKTVATLSGLGWIGKPALLVTEAYGPAVRLNSILTDAPLPPGEPVTESKCGDCSVCVEICPGKAVSGKLWKAGMPRHEFFDAFVCRETNSRVAAPRNMHHHICGMCISNCPRTLAYLKRELG